MRQFTIANLTLATLIGATSCAARQDKDMSNAQATATTSDTAAPVSLIAPSKKGHVAVNGVRYYYEIRGAGEPLLLLHGGLGSIEMFNPVMPILVKNRQVIAVDLHGHGRTQLGNRKISLIDQGDDLAVLLDRLGYKQVDVLGYSLGAGVAFRLGVQHPEKVRRLALVSAAYSTDGYFAELRAMQGQVNAKAAEFMKDTPMYKAYAAIAPDVSEFPKLLDAIGDLMRQDFTWAEDVKKLTVPTILIVGDSDMFRPEHTIEFYKLLGGGQRDAGWQREHMSQNRLAILPNLTHYEMFMAPEMATTARSFLDGYKAPPKWGDQVAKQ